MRLLQRLVAKLAAYVHPPRQTLNKPLNIIWPRSEIDQTPLALEADTALYAKTIAYYRYGEMGAARDAIKRLLESYPDDPWFLEFAGDIHLSSGMAVKAESYYRSALVKRQTDPLILLSLGRALISTNQPAQLADAVTALEAAIKEEPDWGFVKRQLAIAYGRLGKLSYADILLAEEAVINGDKPRAVLLARRVLERPEIPVSLRSRASDILLSLDVPLIVE